MGSHRVRHNCSDLAAAILSLYLLGIPLSPHPVYIAVLGWPFCILAVCGVIFIVEFPCCGWGWTVACQGFQVREACVGVLVGGAGFLLSGVQ